MNAFSRLVQLAGCYGGYRFARALTREQPKVLMYHRFADKQTPGRVASDQFRQQLDYVRGYYQPITLTQLARDVFKGGTVSPNTVVITIDDGYRDFYDIAWPLACELRVPLTLFVATGFINRDLWLWPDKVSWMLSRAPLTAPSVMIGNIELDGASVQNNRVLVWQRLVQYLLSIPDGDKHQAIAELANKWGIKLPENAPPEFTACTWDQLREMQDEGLEVGGHTVTHPSLGQVAEEQARQEVIGCKAMLTQHLGPADRSFCYPNGMSRDYSSRIAAIVEEAGFSCAVTAFSDMLGVSRRFAIRRYAASGNWFQFYKAVSGIELLGHKYRRTMLEVL